MSSFLTRVSAAPCSHPVACLHWRECPMSQAGQKGPGVLDSNPMVSSTAPGFPSCAWSFNLEVDRANDWRSLSSTINSQDSLGPVHMSQCFLIKSSEGLPPTLGIRITSGTLKMWIVVPGSCLPNEGGGGAEIRSPVQFGCAP